MPNPWDPSYPAWYQQWYQQQAYQQSYMPPHQAVYGGGAFPPGPPLTVPPPGPPPIVPTRASIGEPAAKKPCIDLSQPPPPPPAVTSTSGPTETAGATTTAAPAWQAAKRGAVIYDTPRLPTPSPPPPPVVEIVNPPPVVEELPLTSPPLPPPAKPKMQWWYDGQSWVYADKQPEMKEPEPKKPEVTHFSSLSFIWCTGTYFSNFGQKLLRVDVSFLITSTILEQLTLFTFWEAGLCSRIHRFICASDPEQCCCTDPAHAPVFLAKKLRKKYLTSTSFLHDLTKTVTTVLFFRSPLWLM
jgi:hypothetical protein